MCRILVTVLFGVFLSFGPALAEEGRYQLRNNNPIVVLDTKTGRLWKAEPPRTRRDASGKIVHRVGEPTYIMVPIPYEPSPGAIPQPTPPSN